MIKMESIYAWTEEAADGKEGVILAFLPFIGDKFLLQHRNRDIAMRFREIAEAHAKATGHTVRFVRFDRAVEIEVIEK
jgi:hypothetical protein